MSSKEFILGLSERIGTSEEITHRIVKYINKCVGNILESGKGLSIPPLGVFVIEKRMERVVIDPSTQKRMLIPPQNLLKLTDEVNGTEDTASVHDVVKELARLTKLPDDVADTIVNSFLGYIQIALKNDDHLDIDGLGHFQMTSDSQTIFFTPSQTMSSLVNRPFAQFVPVILNDGVVFSDIEEVGAKPTEETKEKKEKEEREEKEQKEHANAEIRVEVPAPTEQQEPSTATEQQETAKAEAPTANQPAATLAEQPLNVQEEQEASSTEVSTSTPRPKNSSLWKIASVFLLLTLVGSAIGYLIGNALRRDEAPEVTETISNDTLQTPAVAEEKELQIDIDEVNSHVTYGAYRITGVDTVIVVSRTQSVKNLSATYFGGEQMEMYIRALNGDKETVEAGDTLRIPHLELK